LSGLDHQRITDPLRFVLEHRQVIVVAVIARGVLQFRGEEYVGLTLPHYFKTVEECAQPLTDTASPVYRAGLRLEQWETRVVPCPFATAFRQHGDVARFAREYVPSLRSWSEGTFLAALAPDRPTEERHEIIERYYGAYEALVRENPAGHRKDLVHIYMTIAKTGA
jgi:hypothetical protein